MVEGKTPPGERVVVYDSDGYFMGPDLAERLAVDGHRVDLVTSLEDVAPFAYETLEQVFLKERLHELGVRMHRGDDDQLVRAGTGRRAPASSASRSSWRRTRSCS